MMKSMIAVGVLTCCSSMITTYGLTTTSLNQLRGSGANDLIQINERYLSQNVAIDRRELKRKPNKPNKNQNGEDQNCQNGALDFSFGISGKVTTKMDSYDSIGYSLAFSGDKILVAGTSLDVDYRFAVAQYNSDGTLDGSFGQGGKARINIGTQSSQAFDIAVQKDGKLVLVGSSGFGRYANVALVRLNKDGSLDKSFGSNGIVTTVIKQDDDEAISVQIQNDGKIVIAGFTYSGDDYDFLVARYNSDGSLDSSFGTGGKAITNVGSDDDKAYGLQIQEDGKIVVVGYSSNGNGNTNNGPINAIAIVRYTPNGKLDSSFGNGGKVRLNIGKGYKGNNFAQDVVIQPSNGKILVTGYSNDNEDSNTDFITIRLNTDGSLDSSFGGDGIVRTDLSGDGTASEFAKSITVQGDGKILVAGYAEVQDNYGFAVARYNDDGSIDSAFGANGFVKQSFGPYPEHAYAVGVQPNGKIVVAGYQMTDVMGSQGYFALLRVCA